MSRKLAKFEVSPEGMRELQEGREPWQLAKELIANAFDEESVQTVQVTLKKEGNKSAVLRVEDDGKGFVDLSHAWTLYAPTKKRSDSTVSGRWNLGEKEILAVASKGKIETTTGSVSFDGSSRTVSRKKRNYGTVVELHLPWTKEQIEQTIEKLQEIDPKVGVFFTVNDRNVSRQETVCSPIKATLDTPRLESGVMQLAKRQAEIWVKSSKGDRACIQELGIPIQEIDCPWTIDIRQKVPLSPNRDTVRDSYLQDVYAEVLNVMVHQLTADESSANWVRIGSVDPRCRKDALDMLRELRFGEKAVLWSSDTLANERAREAGYSVVPPKLLNPEERTIFQSVGLVHSSDKFGLTPKPAKSVDTTPAMQAFADVVKNLGSKLLNQKVTVSFYELKGAYEAAQWSAGQMSFNVASLPDDFFATVGEQQIRLILHEFAHHHGRGLDDEPHGGKWKENLQTLAARLVMIARKSPQAFDMATQMVKCSRCRGSGKEKDSPFVAFDDAEPCHECFGDGKVSA